MMSGRLAGKVAIVTGASLGIGDAIVRHFHREGAQLVLVARGRERLEALVGELGGDGIEIVAGSVADRATADAAVAAAARLGGVDVLVNNAGVDLTGDLVETSEEDTRRIFETNVFGTLWMLQRVARELEAQGRPGSIVNVTSRLAAIGVPTMAVYSASKGAVDALTRGAAVELAPHGIRVNAVAPGLTATPLIDAWVGEQPDPEQFRKDLADTIPQRRLGRPEDVSGAVVYLASDESGHVTGASIPVDGGYTAA